MYFSQIIFKYLCYFDYEKREKHIFQINKSYNYYVFILHSFKKIIINLFYDFKNERENTIFYGYQNTKKCLNKLKSCVIHNIIKHDGK